MKLFFAQEVSSVSRPRDSRERIDKLRLWALALRAPLPAVRSCLSFNAGYCSYTTARPTLCCGRVDSTGRGLSTTDRRERTRSRRRSAATRPVPVRNAHGTWSRLNHHDSEFAVRADHHPSSNGHPRAYPNEVHPRAYCSPHGANAYASRRAAVRGVSLAQSASTKAIVPLPISKRTSR
jgi:hypothetical protein